MQPAFQTVTALLFAHVLADFVLQTNAMVTRKTEAKVQALHGAVVLVTALAALGHLWAWPVAVLALLHVVTDRIKLSVGDTLQPFLLDQAAHIAALTVVGIAAPNLWASGVWSDIAPLDEWMPAAMALGAGVILAVRGGGFAVEKLLAPYRAFVMRQTVLGGNLPNAGAVIGTCERGLTFVFVIAGTPQSVALLIAAKSILRFGTAQGDRRMAEYVIVGTLASVGWALIASYGTVALLSGVMPGVEPLTADP